MTLHLACGRNRPAVFVVTMILALMLAACSSGQTPSAPIDVADDPGTSGGNASADITAPGDSDRTAGEPAPPPEPEPEPDPQPEPELFMHLSSSLVAQGDFLVLELTAPPGLQVASAHISGFDPAPRPFAVGDGLVALVPVSYYTAPGDYDLAIDATLLSGEGGGTAMHNLSGTAAFTVTAKDFDKSYVYLDEETAALPSDPQVAIDYARLHELREQPTPEPLWDGPFIRPTEGWISTDFGEIRYVNDVESGRHNGIDFANDFGTPIYAANSGRVILADYLVMTGYTVVIDHGLGLYSSYSHLDELLTAAGDTVAKGDLIGLMGTTGFSTGPHLHFVINIFHDAVNPWPFMEGELLGRSAGGEAGPGE